MDTLLVFFAMLFLVKHASGWKSHFLSSYHPTLTIPRSGEWFAEDLVVSSEKLSMRTGTGAHGSCFFVFFYWPLTSVSVGHGAVVSVSPENLL